MKLIASRDVTVWLCLAATGFTCSVGAAAPLALNRWTYIEVDHRRGDPEPGLELARKRFFGLAAADVNGDGYLDLVSGPYFYRNPGGDMTKPWMRTNLGLDCDAMLFVDVDGDELADCIATALPNVYWLEAQDRQGTSWKAIKVATAPAAPHVNGQGYALAQIVPGGKPEILLSVGDGIRVFQIPAHPESGDWPSMLAGPGASEQGLAVGDLDGDGWLDVVGGSDGPTGNQKTPRSVTWWQNPHDTSKPWEAHEIGVVVDLKTSFDRFAVADLNADGRADIIATSEWWLTGDPFAHLVWFEQPDASKSGEWTRHVVLNACSLNNLDVADLDHDGDPDLVTCEHKGTAKRLFVLENDGRGRFTEHVIDTGKESHLGTRLADLDGDGDLDMVSIAWDAYQFLHLWRNDAILPRQSRVVLSQDAVDESAGGVACYKIETPGATYLLEKAGFGLSSMVDREGHDWIGFEAVRGSRTAGEYRGFPNAVYKEEGNYFHPRWAGTEPSTSRVDYADDDRVTISADSENGLWACRFDFFPTHCTFTMTREPADHPYWVLYEGAPGGEYEDTDWWIASGNSTRHPMTENHEGDLPAPEWIAFGDPKLDRVFYLLHHEDDSLPDRFYQLENKMTVFGFGREGMQKFLSSVPQSVSIGFLETTDPAAIQAGLAKIRITKGDSR